MNVISRGIRNAFRNGTRTFSIVVILSLTIGLSFTMVVARKAVETKIASVKSSVGNTITISPAGSRGFEGGGNPLTGTQVSSVAKTPHVTSVVESLSDRLNASNTNLVSAVDAGALGKRFVQNNGESFSFSQGEGRFGGGDFTTNFTPPVTVIGTTSLTNLSSTIGGGSFSLKSGSVFNGTSSNTVALVGSALATKNNLRVGSTFTAYGAAITVGGIFDAGNTFSNNQVLMPLATVQKLSGQIDDITNAIATVDSVDVIASTTTAIEKQLGSTADVTNSAQQAQQVIQPLQSIQSITLYSLIGAVIAGSAIILLTMLMIVRERRREIGVLKAIGASNAMVVTQFMTESVTFTLLAAVVGLLLGALASSSVTQMLVTNTTASSMPTTFGRGFGRGLAGAFGRNGGLNIHNIHVAISIQSLLYGLLAAVAIAIIGSALPAWLISKVRPAEVMKAE